MHFPLGVLRATAHSEHIYRVGQTQECVYIFSPSTLEYGALHKKSVTTSDMCVLLARNEVNNRSIVCVGLLQVSYGHLCTSHGAAFAWSVRGQYPYLINNRNDELDPCTSWNFCGTDDVRLGL